MPTYEYVCRACEESLEAVQSIHDDALTVCPSCGGELKKKFSPVGISFKGSGFYKTDSNAASTSTPAKAETKPTDTAPSAGS